MGKQDGEIGFPEGGSKRHRDTRTAEMMNRSGNNWPVKEVGEQENETWVFFY